MILNESTALITGGGSGIGAAIALAFAKAGCRVAISGRRESRLAEVCSQNDTDNAIVSRVADVGDRGSVRELVAWANQTLGRIDILVNSAGVNFKKRMMMDIDPEDWDRTLQINATGAFNCIHEVLPGMRKRQDGLIINISSVAGKRAGAIGGVAYNASKFAMAALGVSVAEEERNNGIRVTNVFPGEVETPILENRPIPVSNDHRARILQPEDIAEAALFVAQLPPRAHVPELVIIPTTQSYV